MEEPKINQDVASRTLPRQASAASAASSHSKKRKRGSRRSGRAKRKNSASGNSVTGDLTPFNTNEQITAMHERDLSSSDDESDDLEGVDAYLDRIVEGGSVAASAAAASVTSGDEAVLLLRPKDVLVSEIFALRRRVTELEAQVAAAEEEIAALRQSGSTSTPITNGHTHHGAAAVPTDLRDPRKRARVGGSAKDSPREAKPPQVVPLG